MVRIQLKKNQTKRTVEGMLTIGIREVSFDNSIVEVHYICHYIFSVWLDEGIVITMMSLTNTCRYQQKNNTMHHTLSGHVSKKWLNMFYYSWCHEVVWNNYLSFFLPIILLFLTKHLNSPPGLMSCHRRKTSWCLNCVVFAELEFSHPSNLLNKCK